MRHVKIYLFLIPLFLVANSTLASSCNFTRDLELGDDGEDVRCLQKYLNSNGYKISNQGAGSPGKETDTFRDLTKEAIAKWQKDNNLAATGYFGPLSRDAYKKKTSTSTVTNTPPKTDTTTITNQVAKTSLDSSLKSLILKAVEQLEDAEDEVSDASNGGTNINSAKDDLDDARNGLFKLVKFLINGDYTKVRTYADDIFESAEDAYKSVGGKTEGDKIEDKIDEVDKMIDDVEDNIDDAEDRGKDVDEAKDLIKDAKNLLKRAKTELDDRNYDDAESLAEEAENTAEDAEDAIGNNSGDKSDAEDAISEAKDAIRDAKSEISEALDKNKDTDDAEDLLDDAEEYFDKARTEFDDENYNDAESLAKKAEQKADDAIDSL